MKRGIVARLREHARQAVPRGPELRHHRCSQRRGLPPVRFLASALIVGTTIFILLAFGDRQALDLRALRALRELASPPVSWVMEAVSWLGWQPQFLLIVTSLAVLLFVQKLLLECAGLLLALMAGTPVYLLLTPLGNRLRPYAVIDTLPENRALEGVSFPSGHVINYVLIFGFAAYLAHTLVRTRWRRLALVVPVLVVIALIGPSRVYLAQHWPSDVFASYLIGGGLLLALIALYRRAKAQQLMVATRLGVNRERPAGNGIATDGRTE